MTCILVIEDEDPIRSNIVEMLELEGYEPLEASNGRVGIDLAQQHRPDLIICDITMPELDGYQVLLELRDMPETSTIPFVFLTARADRSFMRRGMELGADDYVTKPFALSELRAAITTRLTRHHEFLDSAAHGLEQAKQRLVRLVAHELRTPLMSINTAGEIMSRQLGRLSQAQMQELLGSILRGSQRLNRVVEQTVLLIQLESGALNPDQVWALGVPTRLSELVMAATNLARSLAYRHPDVAIRYDTRDGAILVISSPHALRHALAELIANALSFSPPGGEVVIAQWQADGMGWVSIDDQGPGMSPDQLTYALESFHQVDRETQEQQGMGLGLPLARRVIESHAGIFELNSVVGRGTQVVVGLPVTEAN